MHGAPFPEWIVDFAGSSADHEDEGSVIMKLGRLALPQE